MLKDIVSVQPLETYHLFLKFEDGIEGIVDLSRIIEFSGVFAPLKDPQSFAQVKVDPELRTIVWENGADLDPVVLYAIVFGQPLPNYESQISA